MVACAGRFNSNRTVIKTEGLMGKVRNAHRRSSRYA
ncbi:cell shape-determining protein MreC [Paraburkholderia sp. CI3]